MENMTFEKLSKLIEKYNIPHDVHLMSDSGWECGETEMNGVYYNKEENILVFTQKFNDKTYKRSYYDTANWVALKF